MKIKKYYDLYLKMPWEKKMIWSAAVISLIPIAAAWVLRAPPEPAPERASGAAANVDTYIPKGFVLIPIDVQNYEALDSILGKFGVVDLFQSGGPGDPKQHLVARNVRMLRAPQNPAHFAILVQEAEAPGILKFGQNFTVIVRRPEQAGTEFVKDESKTPRSIVYEGN